MPNGYWKVKEHCKEAALQCSSKAEFKHKFSSAYKNSLFYGWLDELCSHMQASQKPRGYWQSKENCFEVIKQCKSFKELREKNFTVYEVCKKNGWLDELCVNLLSFRDVYKWNSKEKIQKEAMKYNSRTEFARKNGAAYQAAHRLNIVDEVCSHMQEKNEFCKRGIYAFEFEDNYAYVGLTYNFNIRKYDHLHKSESKVYEHIKKTGRQPIFRILHDYVDMNYASELEGVYLKKYIDSGWNILNVQRPGNLGGSSPYYTHKRVIELANECETIAEFRKRFDQAYQSARKHGWISEIKKILVSNVNQYGSFQNSYDEVIALARECKSYNEFRKRNPSASNFARRNGFIDEIYDLLSHSNVAKRTRYKYSYDEIKQIIDKCEDLSDFINNYQSAYHAAKRNGWFQELSVNLKRRQRGAYSKDEILKIAFSCENYSAFVKQYGGVYNAALNIGCLEDIRKHFGVTAPSKKITYEDVIKLAKECSSYKEFRTHLSAYGAARRNGWLFAVHEILPPGIS